MRRRYLTSPFEVVVEEDFFWQFISLDNCLKTIQIVITGRDSFKLALNEQLQS